jgi:hypothetical protein
MKPNYDEIEKRANAATEGPWTKVREDMPPGFALCVAATAPGPQHRIYAIVSGGTRPASDQDFIAAARTDVPALVARCRELEKALGEACDRMETARGLPASPDKAKMMVTLERARAILAGEAKTEGKS